MTTIFQWAIVMVALSLAAAAQSGNGSFVPKKIYHRSSVTATPKRSSIPVPKPQSMGPSAEQQLTQIEQQTLHSSGQSASAKSTARPAAAPRVPVAANVKNRNINFKHQAPKPNPTPGQAH